MDQITDSALIALAGLIGVVAFLFLAITKFRWHVFIALVLPILLLGLLPGFDREAYIAAFEQGFGRTLQTIAVVIVLGCIMAEALKHTGAIERITLTMIRWVGKPRMPLALTLSGWVVGIPIFCDIGYIVMNRVPAVHPGDHRQSDYGIRNRGRHYRRYHRGATARSNRAESGSCRVDPQPG